MLKLYPLKKEKLDYADLNHVKKKVSLRENLLLLILYSIQEIYVLGTRSCELKDEKDRWDPCAHRVWVFMYYIILYSDYHCI